MNNRRVVIIAMDQPLDSDAQLRGKMENVDRRAERQSPGFGELDLHAIQQEVNRNLLRLPLLFRGRYMGLPDLMNYVGNDCRFPEITPRNASRYYLFANGFTLNGIYLYQFLHRNGYDPFVVQNYSLVNMEEVLKERPLAVCISSTFLYLDDIREMASRIKACDPEIPVIVGGILVKKIMDAGSRMAPQTLKWLSGFRGLVDVFVIETHGEQTLLKVLEILKGKEGRGLADIPNLAFYGQGGMLSFTRREEEDLPMDETAIAWDEIPRPYLRKTLSVISSQGCHYRCRFCTYHRWFPRVRNKSLETLRQELRRIQRLGFVRHVRFADDNFTADPRRLKSVLEMIIRERFDFTWSAFARANTITPGMVKLMRESGCEFLNMGIESGSREILLSMDKRLDPEETVEAIRLLREHGIYSLGGVIVGYPGETAGTFQETVDLINRSGLNYYHPYLFYYSKSMLVHKEKDRFQIRGVGWAWQHRTMGAVEASGLMAEMIRRVERAYTDGQQKTWETFKLLRGEGYTGEEILELHRLKRDLQLAFTPSGNGETPEVEHILSRMRGLIR
ncbi:MAG: B12-binding domain-containing radical SAM protein [Thermodesulfobacteriota bacterium]